MPRILVVDDDLGTRETFAAILQLAGYSVETAPTGHDALTLIRGRPCDFILADLRLPDMTALDIFRTLRDDLIDIPFVIMTGFASLDSAIDAMKLGARDYVEKPLREDTLLEIARRAFSETTSEMVGIAPTRSERSNTPGQHLGTRPTDRRVIEALNTISAHYGDSSLHLRDVARRVDTSVEHLCRLLKAETGVRFGDHLRSARIQEARNLLRQTSLSVKEVAYRTGFASTTQFDRTFKRCCGQRPGQFRKFAA